MNSPVDIKAVLDAMSDAEEKRSMPVRVHVYFDETAAGDLANIAMAATRTNASNASVLYDTYPPQHAIPDASADMAVLVAGEDMRTGKLYSDLRTMGVPTVVFALNRENVCRTAKDNGNFIEPGDVIAPNASAVPLALSDRAESSPIIVDSTDAKSMFEQFGAWVVEVFKEKRLAFANAFACVRRPLALESVNETAVQNAGIGVVAIIPGADMPLMTLNQVKMLLEMAAAYGEELSLGRIKEIAAIVGGAFACRTVARQAVGLVPGVGWVVKGGIGYVGTVAMGHALLQYFESGTDVAASAMNAVSAIKGAPAWAGVSGDKSIVENAKLAASAAREKAAEAVSNASKNLMPTIASVASAAGDATGFSQADLAKLADRAVGAVRERIGK
ncbi:MAG: hypothetical protein E7000_07340 [Coriobacteriaceae bacterium]|nr:hypothetical protein [Coriobacteriaceae bacterium]